jgi:PAS domain S-box-containing protein
MLDNMLSPNRFELLYGMLLDAIPSSVLLVDEKLHIVSVNRNFLLKSQRGEGRTVGRPLSEVFPTIILENTDIERRIREVFRTGVSVKGQRMTYRAPGVPIRIYYYSILPIPTHQVMLLMEDVTEQVRLSEEVRRVERHLASVVESASDIVLSTDTEGQILTWNSAAEKLSGLSAHEVCGHYFFQFCSVEQKPTVMGIFTLMKSGNESHTTEFPLVTRKGDGILVSWVFSPMKDDYGQTVGAVVVGRDLAERRKLENQLRQSQKLAALGVMAGGIAHEIRNPLAVCYSAAEFLSMDNIEPAFRQECTRKIQTGIQKASAIIENLLRFARPSPDTQMAPVDLHSVITDTLELISNQAKVQQIRIQLDLQNRPALVHGVSGLLQQVFMNIFLNAINAMPDGGLLSISEEIFDAEVAVHIADTGVGIAESDIDKVFDPFHTSSPVGKGTGLGLSICYSIVQQHLGSIQVQSSPGKGTTITARLPLL